MKFVKSTDWFWTSDDERYSITISTWRRHRYTWVVRSMRSETEKRGNAMSFREALKYAKRDLKEMMGYE